MFQSLFNDFRNKIKLENKTKIIMKYGFLCALIVSILSSIILFTYEAFYASPDLYYIGLQVFRISLIIGFSFLVCGYCIEIIKND